MDSIAALIREESEEGERSVRATVYHALNPEGSPTRLEHGVRVLVAILIALSMLAVVLETVPELEIAWEPYFYSFEVFTVALFSIEYVLRIWSIVEDRRFSRPILGRIQYAISFLALIDLIAVLPFFIPALIALDLRFLRGLRLIRLLRVLKMGHYSHGMHLIASVFRRKKHEITVAVGIAIILLVFSSSIMYYIEHEAQPNVFRSIPHALWWGIATLTTVGYGDIYPITPLGKLCSGIIALVGVGVVALPSGILVSGFIEELQQKQQYCTRCKAELTAQQNVLNNADK